MRPLADQSRIAGAADEEPDLGLRGVDPLALAGALAVEERGEDRQREAVRAHPVEVRVAPAGRHRGLRAAPTSPTGRRTRSRSDRRCESGRTCPAPPMPDCWT